MKYYELAEYSVRGKPSEIDLRFKRAVDREMIMDHLEHFCQENCDLTSRDGIASGAGLGTLREQANASGMVTLLEAGLERVRTGDTTVEEMLRVTTG